MEILSEMVKVMSQYQHPNYLEILGKNPKTKVDKFYDGIKNGLFSTDEQASKGILDCSPDSQIYRDLKGKLKNRILNTVFFVNPKNFKINSQYNKIAIHCYKRWTAAKILNSLGAKETAIGLAKQVLKQARKGEISHLVVDITLFLRFHYGVLIGNQKKFDEYNKLFHRYNTIQNWENKAQEYYTCLALYHVKSKAEKSAIHEKAKAFYQELETHMLTYKTYKLIYFGSLIRLVIYTSINNYKTSIEVCKEVLATLDANPLYPTLGKAAFNDQQLICCIQLKLFEEGELLAKEALKFLKPGFYNWFRHQELYFLLSTHTGNYQRAYEVVQETYGTKGFNRLDSKSREVWRIYRMYTNYLVLHHKIISDKKTTKIRLGKFLNELPSFSQDKRGLNIAILIIQTLIHIQRRNYDDAIDRIDAIEKYCSRHLKRNKNFRSNCFIKMLLQISITHFHPVAARRKAARYVEMLHSQPIDVANQAHSIEIIPYEDLWKIVIDSLGDRS